MRNLKVLLTSLIFGLSILGHNCQSVGGDESISDNDSDNQGDANNIQGDNDDKTVQPTAENLEDLPKQEALTFLRPTVVQGPPPPYHRERNSGYHPRRMMPSIDRMDTGIDHPRSDIRNPYTPDRRIRNHPRRRIVSRSRDVPIYRDEYDEIYDHEPSIPLKRVPKFGDRIITRGPTPDSMEGQTISTSANEFEITIEEDSTDRGPSSFPGYISDDVPGEKFGGYTPLYEVNSDVESPVDDDVYVEVDDEAGSLQAALKSLWMYKKKAYESLLARSETINESLFPKANDEERWSIMVDPENEEEETISDYGVPFEDPLDRLANSVQRNRPRETFRILPPNPPLESPSKRFPAIPSRRPIRREHSETVNPTLRSGGRVAAYPTGSMLPSASSVSNVRVGKRERSRNVYSRTSGFPRHPRDHRHLQGSPNFSVRRKESNYRREDFPGDLMYSRRHLRRNRLSSRTPRMQLVRPIYKTLANNNEISDNDGKTKDNLNDKYSDFDNNSNYKNKDNGNNNNNSNKYKENNNQTIDDVVVLNVTVVDKEDSNHPDELFAYYLDEEGNTVDRIDEDPVFYYDENNDSDELHHGSYYDAETAFTNSADLKDDSDFIVASDLNDDADFVVGSEYVDDADFNDGSEYVDDAHSDDTVIYDDSDYELEVDYLDGGDSYYLEDALLLSDPGEDVSRMGQVEESNIANRQGIFDLFKKKFTRHKTKQKDQINPAASIPLLFSSLAQTPGHKNLPQNDSVAQPVATDGGKKTIRLRIKSNKGPNRKRIRMKITGIPDMDTVGSNYNDKPTRYPNSPQSGFGQPHTGFDNLGDFSQIRNSEKNKIDNSFSSNHGFVPCEAPGCGNSPLKPTRFMGTPMRKIIHGSGASKNTGYGKPKKDTSYGIPGKHSSYETPSKQTGYGILSKPNNYGRPVKHSSYGTPVKQTSYKSSVKQTGYGNSVKQIGYGTHVQQTGYGYPTKQTSYGGSPMKGLGYGGTSSQGGVKDTVGWAALNKVSNSLPDLSKAITVMSFIAFSVFVANLGVNAIANISDLGISFGRSDAEWWMNDFSLDGMIHDLDKLFDDNETQNAETKRRHSNVESVLDVVRTVYDELYEVTKKEMKNVQVKIANFLQKDFSEADLPVADVSKGFLARKLNTGDPFAHLEGSCYRRLLCLSHTLSRKYRSDDVRNKLLPFWTFGIGWFTSGEENMVTLLENLRAELAGQSGRDCNKLFSDCATNAEVDTLVKEVREELAKSSE